MNQTEFLKFGDGGTVPNNPELPVMLVKGALHGRSADEICLHFENCGWSGTWTYVVFDFHQQTRRFAIGIVKKMSLSFVKF